MAQINGLVLTLEGAPSKLCLGGDFRLRPQIQRGENAEPLVPVASPFRQLLAKGGITLFAVHEFAAAGGRGIFDFQRLPPEVHSTDRNL